jgi:hypothetical protein
MEEKQAGGLSFRLAAVMPRFRREDSLHNDPQEWEDDSCGLRGGTQIGKKLLGWGF